MAVNLDDLWIGDYVRSKTSGQTGRYEGEVSPGVAHVRVGSALLRCPATDLELAEPPVNDHSLETEPDEDTPSVQEMVHFERAIDLHIDHLNPTLQAQPPATILRYQLDRCRAFLAQAVRHRASQVQIIHGKGKGVLRREVEMVLQDHPHVGHYFAAHGGGAFDVLLRLS